MLDSIISAIEDVRNGKLVIVVDDEDRENEGDFITAAQNITPELINFMAKEGRGLICVPLSETLCKALDLPKMVKKNTALHSTPFTVSVDLLGHGCTTGISVFDRAKTILALINPNMTKDDFGRPGHIFPLIAKDGGVLRRAGHTEAAVDLAMLAGFERAGVLVEILNSDGSMARLEDLKIIAKIHCIKIISIHDLIKYRLQKERLIQREEIVNLPTKYRNFTLHAYTQINTQEHHLALVKGRISADDNVLVRVHSSCVTGDILGSLRCDCGEQLAKTMIMVEKEGKGIIVYMNQEGRGIGLLGKLKAYKLQEQGLDTVEANLSLGYQKDQRDYGVGAQILQDLGVKNIRLITNNPKKRIALASFGLNIVEHISIEMPANPHNYFYLQTKKNKLGHELEHL